MNDNLVYKVTWSHEDHIEELTDILLGVSVELLKSNLVEYVKNCIEPTGWKALWMSPGIASFLTPILMQPINFVADVVNVSQDKLEATIILTDIEHTMLECNPELHKLFEPLQSKEVDVPLTQLYVFANQENKALDMAMTAEVLEQVRFIYEYIWQPWDIYEEVFKYDINLIKERMKVYQKIKTGLISKDIAAQMRELLLQANAVKVQIDDIESQTNACISSEIDQNDIVQLMKLNKTMEQLKARYEILKDPSLRELAEHQEQLERSDIIKTLIKKDTADVLLVFDFPDVELFAERIATLQELLKTLPHVPSNPRLQGFPSLQIALDVAKENSTIILMPGLHTFTHFGALAKGGTICGLGEGIIIQGCQETGDILLDVNPRLDATFHLQSAIIKPLNNQVAMCVHGGSVVIRNCSFTGGVTGVCFLSGSTSKIIDCQFNDQSHYGAESRNNSKSFMKNVTFMNIKQAALRVELDSQISVGDNVLIQSCKSGVQYVSNKEPKTEHNGDDCPLIDTASRAVENRERIDFSSNDEDISYSFLEHI